jgi:hypothetical protein
MFNDRRVNDSTRGMNVAVIILMITFGYLFCVTFMDMTPAGAEQAKTITPFLLGTVIGTLVGFYYGNKHEQPKPTTITPVDEAAIDAAKTKAVAVVETAKLEEVKADAKI